MRAIIIVILLTLAATGLHAQAINQAEPIAHGSQAVLYIDANRNLVNSQLDFRIVPHLGSTSIYVQKKNWKAGGDSAQVWVSDSLKGIARVYLTSAETRNTLLSNRYYAEMWQTDSTGVQRRIASGQILMSYSTIDAEPVTAGDTTGTTNRPEMSRIEADIANHADSLRRLDSLARLALANAATAIHKADSARNAVIAAIEADIADLTGRLDTAGTYDRVYLYGQIAQLYDSLGTLLGLINTKLDADTAAITHLLDAVYARSGGALLDSLRFVSSTANQFVGGSKYFDGVTTLITIRQDTAKGTVIDTLQYWRVGEKRPTWPVGGGGSIACQRPGWVDFYIEWSGARVDNGLPTFSVISDTANNVYMELVEYTVVGSYFTNYRWAGKRIGIIGVFDQFSWVKAQISTVGGNSGNYNPDIQAINRASWGNLGLYFNAPNAAGHVRCWLRVHYQVSAAAAGAPASNTSSYYVKLEG